MNKFIDFKEVCSQLDLRDVARYYGLDFRGELARCISAQHADKTPSMKVYEGNFYCFGCGNSGDAVEFTAQLFNLSKMESAAKLVADFGLNIEVGKQKKREYIPRQNLYEVQEKQITAVLNQMYSERNYLRECREKYRPTDPQAGLHPLFVKSFDLERAEYEIEQFLDLPRAEKLEYIAKLKEEKAMQNWSEMVGQKFQHRADEGKNDTTYTVIGVPVKEHVMLLRSDGFKLEAMLPQLNENGTIEWASSSQKGFESTDRTFKMVEAEGLELPDWSGKEGQSYSSIYGSENKVYTVESVQDLYHVNFIDERGFVLDATKPKLNENGLLQWEIAEIVGQKIVEKSDGIEVEGHEGTWYVVDTHFDEEVGKKVFLLEHEDYGDEVAAIVIDEDKNVLIEDIYDNWLSHFEDYKTEILQQVEAVVQEKVADLQPTQPENTPVYMQSAKHARENGEIELWRKSDKLNIECASDIEKAIIAHRTYGAMAGTSRIDTQKAFNDVVEKHGAERVCVVVAVNMEYLNNDGRISDKNKLWATEIRTPETEWKPCIKSVHATVIDAFADNVRAAYERATKALLEEKNSCNFTEIYGRIAKEVAETQSQKVADLQPKINQPKQEENDMAVNIKASVYPLDLEGSKLKANATVTINDSFAVKNVKIVEGKDGNLNVKMPGFKGRDGEWRDTIIPANKEAAAQIKSVVLEEYAKALELQKSGIEMVKPELNPSDISVKIGSIKDNLGDNKTVASMDLTIADTFIVKGVQVREGGADGLYVAMPSEKGADNKWRDVAHPITPEFSASLKTVVMEKFTSRELNKDNIIGNVSYGKLGDDKKHVGYSGEFAEKVAAELDKAGIAWSGRKDVESGKTTFAVSAKDVMKLNEAVKCAKGITKEKVGSFAEKLAQKKLEAAEINKKNAAENPNPNKKRNTEIGD